MERIWLKQYPAGVPADIDVTQYSSLVELLEESFKKFSDLVGNDVRGLQPNGINIH